MKSEKISIIVPAYNIEKYICRCLDSILNQTYQHIEIVVIDDGSIDDTSNIIDQYQKNHVERIKAIHIMNGGVTNARLIGVNNASGDWIGFVDGDDEIEPDMYERLLTNAIKYSADIAHCGYKTVVDGIAKHFFYNTGNILPQDRYKGIYDLLDGEFVEPSLCNKLYRKELFNCILGKDLIDLNIHYNEDLLMNYYLFLNSRKSIYEDFCPYKYMVRGESATRSKLNGNKKIYDPITVRKRILEDVPDPLKQIAKKRYLDTCISAFITLLMNPGDKKEKMVLRNELLNNQDSWKMLNRNTRIKAWLSCYVPAIFIFLYKFYTRRIQNKKYE